MRSYKLVLVLKSGQTKEKRDKVLSEVKKWLGKTEKEDINEMGEQKLAYPIKREKTGNYVVLQFNSDTLEKDLDKRLTMRDDVLRHLLLRV